MLDEQDELDELEEQPVEETEEPTKSKLSSGLISVLRAIAFVSIVVLVEVVAASMLVPSAQETEKLGRRYVAATAGESLDEGDGVQGTESSEEEVREVELGAYTITRFNPKTSTTLSIDFELYGTVLAEDASEFQKKYEKNKNRIREQVIMTLHGTSTSDLSDAGLGLIKRRILEKVNRSLGQPLVQTVLFSKFNFIER